MSEFDGKILLVTGGTGSFGNAVVKRFLASELAEIRIFSRDEKKQDAMRNKFSNEKLKFILGDVRDIDAVKNAVMGVDFIFHASALKQVPSCEFFPLEAVKTNVLGTENVLSAAIATGVEKVVCLSTDKAVYPINAMGQSKAMMEKVAVAKARNSKDTKVCVTRYGNVMASRGSVIPLFLEQLENDQPITITNPEMTRFMMTLEDAVDLVIYAFENCNSGDIFVQKAPAATIDTLAHALRDLLGKAGHEIKTIGTRHGEKLFEVLVNREDMMIAEDLGGYYRIPADDRDLNYSKFIDKGSFIDANQEEYNSHNTVRLDVPAMQKLLLELPVVRDLVPLPAK